MVKKEGARQVIVNIKRLKLKISKEMHFIL